MKPTADDLRVAQTLAREILDSVGGGKWKTECYDREEYNEFHGLIVEVIAALEVAAIRAGDKE